MSSARARRWALAALLGVACAMPRPLEPRIEHGPLAAEVTDRSAVIWVRAPGASGFEISLDPTHRVTPQVVVRGGDDGTAEIGLDGLLSATEYRYFVRSAGAGSSATRGGSFRTLPARDQAVPLRIAFGGDLAGQQVCRDQERGFPVFAAIEQAEPDLLIGLGDMIYADDTCPSEGRYGNRQIEGEFGRSVDLEGFRAHWRYSRADPGIARVLAQTAYLAVWDDHEVTNDFGPLYDSRADPPYSGQPLLPLGLRAFLEYNPVRAADPGRLYRSVRLGKHAELIVLDTRSHRAANSEPDSAAHAKTMLGAEQRAWLERTLLGSGATWKLVVSSVPLAIPTGSDGPRGRDGWADGGGPTGFERELVAILRTAARARVRNLVFLTTDVHFASVLRFAPFDDHPDFRLHEIATGPLNAGVFSRAELDPTLRPERLLLHPAESSPPVSTFEQALDAWNFGLLDLDAEGALRIRVVNARGATIFDLALAPAPAQSARR